MDAYAPPHNPWNTNPLHLSVYSPGCYDLSVYLVLIVKALTVFRRAFLFFWLKEKKAKILIFGFIDKKKTGTLCALFYCPLESLTNADLLTLREKIN